MKFSKSKKKKMKKIRQQRIKKSYGYVVGLTISHESCLNDPNTFENAKVIDKTTLDGDLYFLIKTDFYQLFIYKVVDISKYAFVSRKKVKKSKDYFENPKSWKYNTDISIEKNGRLRVFDCGQYDYI